MLNSVKLKMIVEPAKYTLATFLLITCLLWSNCRKDELETVNLNRGHDYFPIEIGFSWTYQVDSIVFNKFNERIDTLHYNVKFVAEDSIQDSIGSAIKMVKYIQQDTSFPWSFDSELVIQRDDNVLRVKQNNETITKLIFPLDLYKYWDGNILNSGEEELFEVVTLHEPFVGLNIQTDSSLRVIHRDRINALERFYGEEVYANKLGLIYKREIDKRSTSIGQQIPNGFDYSYQLISFEK